MATYYDSTLSGDAFVEALKKRLRTMPPKDEAGRRGFEQWVDSLGLPPEPQPAPQPAPQSPQTSQTAQRVTDPSLSRPHPAGDLQRGSTQPAAATTPQPQPTPTSPSVRPPTAPADRSGPVSSPRLEINLHLPPRRRPLPARLPPRRRRQVAFRRHPPRRRARQNQAQSPRRARHNLQLRS
jgi:hypothetical protein